MTRCRRLLLAIALLLIGSRAVRAQSIGVSGNPALLRISAAIAGSEPVSVTDASSTYTISTPNANRTYKITAQLNAAMPVGVTLTATLAAPVRATSLGAISLDVVARDVVTGIPKNANTSRSITYQLTATVAAGVVPVSTRIVTFTIVQSP